MPPKPDYQGKLATLSGRRVDSQRCSAWAVCTGSENLGVGTGINNPFDKRQFREGNALVAGAHTYNEPGRTFSSLNLSF